MGTRAPERSRAADVARPVALAAARRIDAVDILRGVVMVVMLLDHVRAYFSTGHVVDMANTSLAYFLTRWVTHFCAPVFCFLAGTSAYLSGSTRRTPAQLSSFLLTRGAWLVFVEVTIVNFGWYFHLTYPFTHGVVLQVIWALGVSMIVLAGLVRLPLWMNVAIGLAMIGGHNLFDAVRPADLGAWANVWRLLHVRELTALGPVTVNVLYPLVPWIGVMAAGYAFGALVARASSEPATGWRRVLGLGLIMTAAFLVVRAIDGYGDPIHWSPQPTAAQTLMSFLNTSKYPPSLLYLLMTLGPAIAALPWLARCKGRLADACAVIGRVPFFFYVVHIYVIHAVTVALGWLQGYPPSAMMDRYMYLPNGYGFSLPVVYLIWILIVLALYPLCRWFAGVKARHRDKAWLSYL